jgi:hypothetical protein
MMAGRRRRCRECRGGSWVLPIVVLVLRGKYYSDASIRYSGSSWWWSSSQRECLAEEKKGSRYRRGGWVKSFAMIRSSGEARKGTVSANQRPMLLPPNACTSSASIQALSTLPHSSKRLPCSQSVIATHCTQVMCWPVSQTAALDGFTIDSPTKYMYPHLGGSIEASSP